MFAFKTLQRRLIVLLVVPVTLFLMILGVFGYRFTKAFSSKSGRRSPSCGWSGRPTRWI